MERRACCWLINATDVRAQNMRRAVEERSLNSIFLSR